MNKKERLIIIDSNSLIHRAYHALPPLTTKDGELVNAVYGFLLVFFRAVKDFQPDFVAAAFDLPCPTFRHEKFKKYKAKRPPTPKELSQQILKVKELLKTFNVPTFEKEGFEADDIIGTISGSIGEKQISPKTEVIILSGDLDALQLVNPRTKVYVPKKGVKDTVLYDEKLVRERYRGLTPPQLPDLKALRGDPSDNIPGVPGIGEKTGIRLINEFGCLENLYKEIDSESERVSKLKPRLKTLLKNYKEQAFLCKMLSQIRGDAPIGFDLEKCRFGKYDKEKINRILKKFEFNSLLNRLPGPRESISKPLTLL